MKCSSFCLFLQNSDCKGVNSKRTWRLGLVRVLDLMKCLVHKDSVPLQKLNRGLLSLPGSTEALKMHRVALCAQGVPLGEADNGQISQWSSFLEVLLWFRNGYFWKKVKQFLLRMHLTVQIPF